MALGYSCGTEDDNGIECYSAEQCAENEQCLEGVCEELTWPECKIKENLQSENFNGTYEVMETDCSNKYGQISFEGDNQTFNVGAIDKKTGEFVCLDASGDPNVNGNYLSSSDYNFIKCDDLTMKMKWYGGECEGWLEKTSDEPIPGTDDNCN